MRTCTVCGEAKAHTHYFSNHKVVWTGIERREEDLVVSGERREGCDGSVPSTRLPESCATCGVRGSHHPYCNDGVQSSESRAEADTLQARVKEQQDRVANLIKKWNLVEAEEKTLPRA